MITVIIPTMWKGKELNRMLPALNDHPLVGEIILIDNESANKVEETCKLSKVVYYDPGKNIYPVPSWNYGWENAKYDKLMIINDDVMFDLCIVDVLDQNITEDMGMFTLDPAYVNDPLDGDMNIYHTRKPEDVKIIDNIRLKHKAAIVIGIHRKVYEKIPEEILIHYNDEFLFRLCITRNKPNKSLSNIQAKTHMSTTVQHFRTITKNDQRAYKDAFLKAGVNPG